MSYNFNNTQLEHSKHNYIINIIQGSFIRKGLIPSNIILLPTSNLVHIIVRVIRGIKRNYNTLNKIKLLKPKPSVKFKIFKKSNQHNRRRYKSRRYYIRRRKLTHRRFLRGRIRRVTIRAKRYYRYTRRHPISFLHIQRLSSILSRLLLKPVSLKVLLHSRSIYSSNVLAHSISSRIQSQSFFRLSSKSLFIRIPPLLRTFHSFLPFISLLYRIYLYSQSHSLFFSIRYNKLRRFNTHFKVKRTIKRLLTKHVRSRYSKLYRLYTKRLNSTRSSNFLLKFYILSTKLALLLPFHLWFLRVYKIFLHNFKHSNSRTSLKGKGVIISLKGRFGKIKTSQRIFKRGIVNKQTINLIRDHTFIPIRTPSGVWGLHVTLI